MPIDIRIFKKIDSCLPNFTKVQTDEILERCSFDNNFGSDDEGSHKSHLLHSIHLDVTFFGGIRSRWTMKFRKEGYEPFLSQFSILRF